jgi:dTDP-4-dehydrorhamnose 3,5-epimerase
VNVTRSEIPEILVIEPRAFVDGRGFFFEAFHAERYAAAGIPGPFVQDNVSRSAKGTLRGLHFQEPNGQGKLVQVLRGAVWDVAVDVRRGSPSFGAWVGVELTEENRRQVWIPAGFAHGFCVVSGWADVFYKCTEAYSPAAERTIRWDDPAIGIRWPIKAPRLSTRDGGAQILADARVLPTYPP